MARYGFLNLGANLILKSFLVLSLIFCASALFAQSPVDFSGI